MFALQEIGSDTAAERAERRRRRPAYSALGKLITSRCFPNRRGAARAHAHTRARGTRAFRRLLDKHTRSG